MNMGNNYWVRWLKAAGLRAIRTVAQTAVGMLSINMVGILDADWKSVASVAIMSGIVSMLTSVAGLPEVGEE